MNTKIKFSLILVALCFPVTTLAGSISGNIVMPGAPYSQPTNMTIFVRASSPSDPTPRQQSITVTPAEAFAGTPQPYTVNGLLPGMSYILSYDCNSFGLPLPCENIVPRAYYLSPASMIVRSENALLFDGSSDYNSIDVLCWKEKRLVGR